MAKSFSCADSLVDSQPNKLTCSATLKHVASDRKSCRQNVTSRASITSLSLLFGCFGEAWSQIRSKKKSLGWTKRSQGLAASGAQSANGDRMLPAAGIAAIAGIRNFSSMVAARFGTLSIPGACVQAAGTNGAGRVVCPAKNGHDMKTGTQQTLIKSAKISET